MSGDPKRPVCFVIGPIGKDFTPERKQSDFLLRGLIKPVLKVEEFGYRVKRADEDATPGMISDRVISDLINAELVVADLTGLNPNAFYELGIRHREVKPTIYIAKIGTELPFDNVGHRTIFIDTTDWQSIEDGRLRLASSVREVKDPNFRVTNPVTQASATLRLRESADPNDRAIAELLSRPAPDIRLIDVTIPQPDPTLRLTFPLKCYVTLQNASGECSEVRLATYRDQSVTLKQFVTDVLQIKFQNWAPSSDGADRIAVYLNSCFELG